MDVKLMMIEHEMMNFVWEFSPEKNRLLQPNSAYQAFTCLYNIVKDRGTFMFNDYHKLEKIVSSLIYNGGHSELRPYFEIYKNNWSQENFTYLLMITHQFIFN